MSVRRSRQVVSEEILDALQGMQRSLALLEKVGRSLETRVRCLEEGTDSESESECTSEARPN